MTKQIDKSAEPLSRAERKAALLAQLEQQRIDILVCSDYLQRSTSPLDQNWRSIKLPLYAAGGLLAYKFVRRPGGIMAAARKGLAGYMMFRKFKLLTKIAT
ncbi:YqjK family protein [Vreelandella populi]|uniref:YqjK-like protein n=1 Tax=Vreelandella populi TaxID=2498858 RepID=A0A433L7F7_9GAMM|nr:YqjK family protein [Halomonas populi]RUR36063.1 hypothetical protein ELY25_14175 [Halomonas populi]RUR43196.1 hypothetical protein ELY37_18745 [Halomonas populi]RUR57622.1 hypothetical protein ELY40_00895 [Halomonas populi]